MICKKFTVMMVVDAVDLCHSLSELNNGTSKQLFSSTSSYIYC